MDMGGDTSMTMAMRPYLHFTGGDALWFQAWAPTSHGAIAGACIGLVLLAMFERLVAAMRGLLEVEWAKSASITKEDPSRASTSSNEVLAAPSTASPSSSVQRLARQRPFIPTHDLARGVVYSGQAFLGYLLMLAVMTFNAGYIISIIVGLGIGEMLFGRFAFSHLH
ncbi:hypothetical protein DL93DRAFT_2049857 [Clavulina sp. PMI_390]|nr:hypothetical protein DL93DRAFT_2049857 [Clavulina sp. PMI_390]